MVILSIDVSLHANYNYSTNYLILIVTDLEVTMVVAYCWDRGQDTPCHNDSICIYQVITPEGKAGIASLCGLQSEKNGMSEVASGVSGYWCERIINWFYNDFIHLLGKNKSNKIIKNSLLRHTTQFQNEISEIIKAGVILVFRGRYFIIINSKRMFLWKRYGKKPDSLLNRSQKEGVKLFTGKVKPEQTILLAGYPVEEFVTKKELHSAFSGKQSFNEKNLERLLGEISLRAKTRGMKGSTSIISVHFH